MKNKYVTTENENFKLEKLSKKEYEFLKIVMSYYYKKPDWDLFSNYWINEGHKTLWKRTPRRKVVETPIFRICQDLEIRLGIKQGKTRLRDYRDELEELIDKTYESRYQFCKKTGIAQDTLSRILNKRREPSLRLLNSILDALGYKITFQKKPSS